MPQRWTKSTIPTPIQDSFTAIPWNHTKRSRHHVQFGQCLRVRVTLWWLFFGKYVKRRQRCVDAMRAVHPLMCCRHPIRRHRRKWLVTILFGDRSSCMMIFVDSSLWPCFAGTWWYNDILISWWNADKRAAYRFFYDLLKQGPGLKSKDGAFVPASWSSVRLIVLIASRLPRTVCPRNEVVCLNLQGKFLWVLCFSAEARLYGLIFRSRTIDDLEAERKCSYWWVLVVVTLTLGIG
jgi:hypothetical protein